MVAMIMPTPPKGGRGKTLDSFLKIVKIGLIVKIYFNDKRMFSYEKR
jgi:hypothetical protein